MLVLWNFASGGVLLWLISVVSFVLWVPLMVLCELRVVIACDCV